MIYLDSLKSVVWRRWHFVEYELVHGPVGHVGFTWIGYICRRHGSFVILTFRYASLAFQTHIYLTVCAVRAADTRLSHLSALGTGLLLGTALGVIIPEYVCITMPRLSSMIL